MDSETPVNLEQFNRITVATIRTAHLEGGGVVAAVVDVLKDCVRTCPGIHLLLNFHRVSRVSVAFLADLAELRRTIEANGGTLRLCSLPRDVRDVLGVFGLKGLYLAHKTRHALTKYHAHLQRAQMRVPFPRRRQCSIAEWRFTAGRVISREVRKVTMR